MQLPVVSTAVGDVAALLAGLPGCAVVNSAEEPNLAAGLARALDQALDHGPGPAARERVRPYGQARIAARLLAVYDGLLAAADRDEDAT